MCGHVSKEKCYRDNYLSNNDLTKISHTIPFAQIITHNLDISLPYQGITRESSLFEHMKLPLTLMRATHISRMDIRSLENLCIHRTLSEETMEMQQRQNLNQGGFSHQTATPDTHHFSSLTTPRFSNCSFYFRRFQILCPLPNRALQLAGFAAVGYGCVNHPHSSAVLPPSELTYAKESRSANAFPHKSGSRVTPRQY